MVTRDWGREHSNPLVSIVVALHNEEGCIDELAARVDRTLAEARCRFELVLVDDASTDASFARIEGLVRSDPRIRGLRLLQNEGHQTALMLGMAASRGDVIVTMDADLQHPPERIPEMLERWRSGFEIVHMRRRAVMSRSALREAMSAVFCAFYNLVSEVRVLPRSTDFRLVDRRCVDALSRAFARDHFLRASARRIEFAQTELVFDASQRFAGTPRYTVPKLATLAADAIFTAIRRTAL